MCDFCNEDKIPTIENEYDVNPLEAETEEFPFREKLILAKLHGEYVFYGFNKYRYEDDTIYYETEANYCPVCGRKLMGGIGQCANFAICTYMRKKTQEN